MKNINIDELIKNKITGNIIILIASITLVYLLISIYFTDHFFFNTVINGVNVSLKAHADTEDIIRSYVEAYRLQLIERDGESDEIIGQAIRLQYNEKADISKIYHEKTSFKWIISLFKSQDYYINNLFIFDEDILDNEINVLNCLNKEIIVPQNVGFKYSNGSYEAVDEVYGNKIDKEKLNEAVKHSLMQGARILDLDKGLCYENPKYTLNSSKTTEAKSLLNKYVSTKITYIFGELKEILDGSTINEWLSVDGDLEVKINEIAAMKYVKELGRKYNTVGIPRKFKTSMGRIVEVKGGLYGWKINLDVETWVLLEDIKLGRVIDREPIYAQRSLPRGENEIGDTYVEINITKQYLWFYKNGRLIAQGAIVTGNPNKGNATNLGIYMLNYKQKDANLTGPDYEAEVTYWMPFFGNIGIHDATWRHSFGGEIYKRNGSHGCVNVSLSLAKKIYENIEDGTPIILYEE